MIKPTILILLSTYNGEKYLKQQLDSILDQKDVDIKLLIRDDCSTDSTLSILNNYQKKFPKQINLFQGENIGFIKSFSYLVKIGLELYPEIKYYAFADQDDYWEPEKIRKAYEKIHDIKEDVSLLYCSDLNIVDENLKELGYKIRKSDHYTNNFINNYKYSCLLINYGAGCTMLFNKKAAQLYNQIYKDTFLFHDDLMYRICMILGKVVYDETSYIRYRQHSLNSSGAAPSPINKLKKRLKFTWLYGHKLEKINKEFYRLIENYINYRDKEMIQTLMNYRQSLFKRFQLLFNKKIRYYSKKRDFLYRIRIILGTV